MCVCVCVCVCMRLRESGRMCMTFKVDMRMCQCVRESGLVALELYSESTNSVLVRIKNRVYIRDRKVMSV